MNIGIDVTSALNQKAGIARYTKKLVLNLLKENKKDFFKLYAFFGNNNENLFNHKNADLKLLNYPPQTFKAFLFFLRVFNKTPDFLTKEADIIHSIDFVLPASAKKASIVSVHDLAFLHFNKLYTYKNKTYMKSISKFSLNNADAIIAISQNTKKDIVKFVGIDSNKIFVTHLAADKQFRPIDTESVGQTKDKYGLKQDYILYVGTIQPRKNIHKLIEAFKIVKNNKNIDHKLVIVGEKGWYYKQVVEEINNNDDIIHIEQLHEHDLPAIYTGATAFVYPSLYEGFGLPPLEAMACGTPVVCSNTSSLPEVVEDAALTVDPKQEEAIAIAITKIIEDKVLAQNLKEKGLAQASKFSWQKTAKQTLEIYKKVAN